MKKVLIISLYCLLFSVTLPAQNVYVVQGGGKGSLYLNHIVVAKEGLYSIARKYHMDPKELAAYNGLSATQGLAAGQTLKIPLNKSNFSQDINASARAGVVPVYYTVKQGEGMYRVRVNHENVSYEALKKWNKLPGESLNAGQSLIVGYVTATGAVPAVAAVNQQPVANIPPVKEEKKTPPVAMEEKKNIPPPSQDDKKETAGKNNDKKEVAVVQADPPRSVNTDPKPQEPVYVPKGNSYFQRAFEDEVKGGRKLKSLTLNGAIFKSTSGWQDARFYILVNDITPGTLVKVNNPLTNKFIIAKVLGEVPDLRQNSGLQFRLSNAGAAELGIKDETKFSAELAF